ncbi:hypothetical protein BJ508DRAFT_159870 [Ascobolus immersus RN42]|uniref:C2H2-type domain-containing protein n=1 Tax=Ascobolus immersus RN42 TaxID=1160509 RepID=A0A3N4HWJ6_ASCIM|nr:hypothetical protein BJ508DRAFT_159870 [Ascobolus immersus RN42]
MLNRMQNQPFRSESPTSDSDSETFKFAPGYTTPQASYTHKIGQQFGKNYRQDGTAISNFFALRQENNTVLFTEVPCQTSPHFGGCAGQCYAVASSKSSRPDSKYYCTVPGCPEQGLVSMEEHILEHFREPIYRCPTASCQRHKHNRGFFTQQSLSEHIRDMHSGSQKTSKANVSSSRSGSLRKSQNSSLYR